MKTNADTVSPAPSKNQGVQSVSTNPNVQSKVSSSKSLFDRQKALFATGVTRSYAWRVEQLDRMGRLLQENEADRKSTRLNSSHGYISYAVFCLKKKKRKNDKNRRVP